MKQRRFFVDNLMFGVQLIGSDTTKTTKTNISDIFYTHANIILRYFFVVQLWMCNPLNTVIIYILFNML